MKEKVGSGRRFRALSAQLAAKGARNPAALAAHIGRQKYGAKRMAALAAAGRRRAEAEGPDVATAAPKKRRRL